MLDFYGWKEGTLISLWVTVLSSTITIFLSSFHLFSITFFNVALVYNMMAVCVAAGIWGSLQFTSLQRQHPRMTLLLERLLFALMPSSPPVIMTWATIAVTGSSPAPWYLLLYLTVGLFLFVLPVRSSFRVLGKGRSRKVGPAMDELDELVMGRFETSAHIMCYGVFPSLIKTAVHHSHMYNTYDDVADVLLLHCIPILVIIVASEWGSLWWVGMKLEQIRTTRNVLGALMLFAVVGGIEVRVIFHSFRHYIKLSYPYDYAVITAGCYSLALIGIAHFSGVLRRSFGMVLLTTLGAISILSFEVALGMPWYMLPFGAAGAAMCARFYYHRSVLMRFVCRAHGNTSLSSSLGSTS